MMGGILVECSHAPAVIHTVDDKGTAIDELALTQVRMLCDAEAREGAKIRVVPDVHAGKVGPVGLTMTVGERVMPALVGNDIDCGVTATQVSAKGPIGFARLAKVDRGIGVRTVPHGAETGFAPSPPRVCPGTLSCHRHVRESRAVEAAGPSAGTTTSSGSVRTAGACCT